MLLLDKVLCEFSAHMESTDAVVRSATTAGYEVFSSIPRFRVEENTSRMIWGMAESQSHKILASAKHVHVPSNGFWVEFPEVCGMRQFGFLVGMTGERTGNLTAFSDYQNVDNSLVLETIKFDLENIKNYSILGPQSGVLSPEISHGVAAISCFLLVGFLSIMATPRMCIQKEVSLARLNKKRVLRGRRPLVSYREVLIDPRQTKIVTPSTGQGSPKALHFVRAHLRIRLGRAELVRPHWRGNAELGVKRPAYRLRAA